MEPDFFIQEARTPSISGLCYFPEFLTKWQELEALHAIDCEGLWSNDLRRRVQHFGYKYDYKARKIDESMRAAPFPGWLSQIGDNLKEKLNLHVVFDQAIVNEYLPGQGIFPHIDCEPCFSETIVSVSLGSACIMDFMNHSSRENCKLILEPRSALLLKGDARYKWTHGIAQRKFDRIKGMRVARSRRVSITFRHVILAGAI